MTSLYNKEGLLRIEKEKKMNLYLLILFSALFVISLMLFIVFSAYKTKTLFTILACVADSIFVIFVVLFASKFVYLKRVANEYKTLLESKEEIIHCEILECSKFITTLPDKSRCHEVLVKKDDKESIYYLSELFEIDDIKPGKCVISISYDYLKGYQYED